MYKLDFECCWIEFRKLFELKSSESCFLGCIVDECWSMNKVETNFCFESRNRWSFNFLENPILWLKEETECLLELEPKFCLWGMNGPNVGLGFLKFKILFVWSSRGPNLALMLLIKFCLVDHLGNRITCTLGARICIWLSNWKVD